LSVPPVVGVVSPGAMGSAVGRALRDGGARVVTTVAGRSPRTEGLAGDLERLGSLHDVVQSADLVLSIVPPAESMPVARSIAAAAGRVGSRPLVADLNAVAPATAREISVVLAEAGLELVDGSISGPPPRAGATTRVYLSGGRAAEVADVAAPGIAWRIVGSDVGLASAVKMSTASVYKGSVALLVQALRAAHANGVLEPVLDDLRHGFPELADDPAGTVQRAVAKAHRYVGEMQEIAATQTAAGLTPALFEALSAVYQGLADTAPAAAAPEDANEARTLDELIDSL
jgi:3-hydroxyisobutyrate dehydrogenase-like beta-hydroxyacid dehydrogenase